MLRLISKRGAFVVVLLLVVLGAVLVSCATATPEIHPNPPDQETEPTEGPMRNLVTAQSEPVRYVDHQYDVVCYMWREDIECLKVN
jgi:hypothetical protein